MKIVHHRALAMLGDYAAGELSSTTYQAITEHLQTCETCRKNLAAIEQIRTRLRSFALSDALVEQKNTEFSSLLEQSEWRERATIPGQMLRVRHRQSLRRSPILLAATLLVAALLLSVAITFTIMTFQYPTGAQPHLQPYCLTLPFTRTGNCITPTPTLIPEPTPTPTPAVVPTPTPTSLPMTLPTSAVVTTPTSLPIVTPTPINTP